MVPWGQAFLSKYSDSADRNQKGLASGRRRRRRRSDSRPDGKAIAENGSFRNRIADGASVEGVCISRMFGEDKGRSSRGFLDRRQSITRQRKERLYVRIANEMSTSLEEHFNQFSWSIKWLSKTGSLMFLLCWIEDGVLFTQLKSILGISY